MNKRFDFETREDKKARMSIQRIMVTFPLSGFAIHLPKTAIDVLGGINTPVEVSWVVTEDGRREFLLLPNKNANLKIRLMRSRTTYPARLQWNSKIEDPVDFNFAPTYVEWQKESNTYTAEGSVDCISFYLPKKEKLQPPNTKNKVIPKEPLLKFPTKKTIKMKGEIDSIKKEISSIKIDLEELNYLMRETCEKINKVLDKEVR